MAKRKSNLKRCSSNGLVIFATKLDAEIVLAKRVWKDSGEDHVFECPRKGHWHLSRPLTQPISDGKIEA